MTNEKKAAEIIGCTQKDCNKCDFHNLSCFEYKHLMEMAEWKDKKIAEQEQMIFACKSDIKRLQRANRNLQSELRNQAKKIRKLKSNTNE